MKEVLGCLWLNMVKHYALSLVQRKIQRDLEEAMELVFEGASNDIEKETISGEEFYKIVNER